jgi:cell division protein FtsL
MTARPLRSQQPKRAAGLRVIGGRRAHMPRIGPFAIFGIVVVASMFGIVVARTSLDAGAFELADLDRQIAAEQNRQELLVLEVARMESPERVGPLAQEMGLVIPENRQVLLVVGINERNPEDLVVASETQMAMNGPP